MTEKKQIPIDADLFTWPTDRPRLFATKCLDCSNIVFPVQDACPKCGGKKTEKIELKDKGTLWTWTSQEFRPKGLLDYQDPEAFNPYYLGMVELPDQVRVETRLLVDDPSKIEIGMSMELAIIKFREEPDGTETMSYVFKPANE